MLDRLALYLRSARSLSLLVASTSRRVRNTSSLSRAVTAMAARRWLPSTSVGLRSSRRSSSRSRRRRCVAIVLSARSGRRCPTRAGILQERLELRCEDRVAVIDRVLRITDQMGEAELVRLGVCALRRQTIRQPHLRPHAVEKVRRHALAARRRDHMIDGGGAAERPLPVRLALHARAGLVAGDHLAGAHGGGDLLCCRARNVSMTLKHLLS